MAAVAFPPPYSPDDPPSKVCEASHGKQKADKVAEYFLPAVEHLGKWMPLYLAPPLIVLPNALGEVIPLPPTQPNVANEWSERWKT